MDGYEQTEQLGPERPKANADQEDWIMYIEKEQGQVEQTSPERPKVSADQEDWIRSRILTAMRMALAIKREVRVGADKPSYDHAIWGIAEGTAIEVIHELGLQPSYINLRNLESSKGLP